MRTLHFSGISVAAINVLAFVFAIMFSSRLIHWKNFWQSLVFLPVVLSVVAVGVVWEFMYQSTGLIPVMLRKIIGMSPAWLTNTKAAPYAMIIIYVWKSVGYYMVIYIAGLLDVPVSFYEAARIDGAGFWGQLWYITIPSPEEHDRPGRGLLRDLHLRPVRHPVRDHQRRAQPFHGDHGHLIYRQAFELSKFGYSAAISVLFFLTMLVFSLIQLRLFKSGHVGG